MKCIHNVVWSSTLPSFWIFPSPKTKPWPHWQALPILPSQPRPRIVSFLSLYNCLFWILHINGIIWYVAFFMFTLFSRVIRTVVCLSTTYHFRMNNLMFSKKGLFLPLRAKILIWSITLRMAFKMMTTTQRSWCKSHLHFFATKIDPKSSSESRQTANRKPDLRDTNISARAYNVTHCAGTLLRVGQRLPRCFHIVA